MNIFIYFVFIFIASFLIAETEIQTEGKFGWAKMLPTWRRNLVFGPMKFELTGYHLFFFFTIFFILQFRFIFQPFTLKDELLTISAYLFIMIFEDFL